MLSVVKLILGTWLPGAFADPDQAAPFAWPNIFGLNLFEATVFRRYGFLAATTVRVAFYVIWHVIYIH